MATQAPKAGAALAKKILRYLRATPLVGIMMSTGTSKDGALDCYCDASFAPFGGTIYTCIVLMWLWDTRLALDHEQYSC